MKRPPIKAKWLSLLLIGGLAACVTPGGGDDGPDTKTPEEEFEERLAERQYHYGAALRTASLRLVGELPTVEQIEAVASSQDPKGTYEGLIKQFLEDPRFQPEILDFWRNTFKMGQSAALDTAPAFAALLTVQGRSYNELFTATTGNCPTVQNDGATITAANCQGGAPAQAGLLTNPAVMEHYYSNMAFRRTRWVQETFACTAFPAEIVAATTLDNGAQYTAPWDFNSISGPSNGGTVDFHDAEGVVCANCHATMNHLAPLFANFDENGQYQNQISVPLPTDGNPTAALTDFIPAGEQTAWRLGVPTASLTELGQAMAADPAVAECAVARAWNFALGRGDIVDTLSTVPSEVIAGQVQGFADAGYRFDTLLYNVFTSEDFTKY